MLSALRRHLNPTTAIAIVALVFAMTGGAWAAKHYTITSTSQIKPKVLKALKGKAGPRGPKGETGAPGAAGPQGPAGTGNASNAYASEQDTPITLSQYSTWTDVETTNITLSGTHKVLIVGQYTAQTPDNKGDAFVQVLVDGNKVDGNYWTNLGSTGPGTGAGRATLPVSRVITLGAGTHTVKLQGSYYDGGTTISVSAYARSLSVVDLG